MADLVFSSISDITRACDGILRFDASGVAVEDERGLRGELIDRLVWTAVFGNDDAKAVSTWLIRQAAARTGAYTASINDLYMACGRGEYNNKVTPAINLRGLTYDMARTVFQAAHAHKVGAHVFELARSEMGYTEQRPAEYASNVLAAAIKEGHKGPVFIQGDHYQANAKRYGSDPDKEINGIADLIREAIAAGYGNIDIDCSTLVDLSYPTLAEQQKANYVNTAELTRVVREAQPQGMTVSVGAEIGEVGKQNSTVEDLDAFMAGYVAELERLSKDGGHDLAGISKISVQTGTSHGGVPLPDGTIADVNVDFETLARLSKAAKERWHIGGAVQHGASTLPEEAFGHFRQANAVEVHLATAFQNKVLDSSRFPKSLTNEIHHYLDEHHSDERKPDMTDAQFYYKTRKQAFGPFKRQMWDLPAETRQAIMDELRPRFALLMQELGVYDTVELVASYIKPIKIDIPAPAALKGVKAG